MQKLKLLIVEDQENYITSLLDFLSPYNEILDLEDITKARTYHEARNIILNRGNFDVSILDYHLNGKTCFNLLEETKSNILGYGQIVFTSIDQDEQKNFLKYYRPISRGYLVLEKPFDGDNIALFINEIQKTAIFNPSVAIKKLTLDLGGTLGERIIEGSDINDVVFIQGALQYCNYFIIVNEQIVKVNNVTGHLEEHCQKLINNKNFLRVHKSYIVNVTRIKGGLKDKPTTGWLSFKNLDFSKIKDEEVARFSTEHPNYSKLKEITRLQKI